MREQEEVCRSASFLSGLLYLKSGRPAGTQAEDSECETVTLWLILYYLTDRIISVVSTSQC